MNYTFNEYQGRLIMHKAFDLGLLSAEEAIDLVEDYTFMFVL